MYLLFYKYLKSVHLYYPAGWLLCILLLPAHALFCQQDTVRSPEAGLEQLIKPGASLVAVSKQFIFTEGPAVDKTGNVYFTDQPNDRIWKYDTDGRLSLFMDKTSRSNGLYFDKNAGLVACADEKNELVRISRDKKITVLLNNFNGQRFNGPNDLWIDGRGGIYFTDPYYQRDYWQRKKPGIERMDVYYLPKGGKAAVVVDSLLQQPNGIVGTPDGKNLFVADIRAGQTWRYDIAGDGRLTNRVLFAAMGSDGMTLDEKGNLYLTGKGITVFSPAGKRLGTIPVPAGWVGNLCFAGKDRRTLFITASETVYTLQMNVRGVE